MVNLLLRFDAAMPPGAKLNDLRNVETIRDLQRWDVAQKTRAADGTQSRAGRGLKDVAPARPRTCVRPRQQLTGHAHPAGTAGALPRGRASVGTARPHTCRQALEDAEAVAAAGQAEAAAPGEDDGERKQPGGGVKRALPAARPAVSVALRRAAPHAARRASAGGWSAPRLCGSTWASRPSPSAKEVRFWRAACSSANVLGGGSARGYRIHQSRVPAALPPRVRQHVPRCARAPARPAVTGCRPRSQTSSPPSSARPC